MMSADSQLDVVPPFSLPDSSPGNMSSRDLIFISHCLKGIGRCPKSKPMRNPDEHGTRLADRFLPVWKEQ